jgi:lipoprotein-releasing system permease protein
VETHCHIAVRLLLSKKRAMLMSLSGIVFGVGLFIITQAQTAGFEQFFTRTALGTDGALHIEDPADQDVVGATVIKNASGSTEGVVALGKQHKYVQGIAFPGQISDALREFKNVAAVAQVLRGDAVLDSNFRQMPAQVLGIDLDNFLTVSNLAQQIIYGRLDDFRADLKGVMLGSQLAARANLQVGDPVIISRAGESERYRVEAIFESGVEHIDKERVILHLPEARAVLAQPFGVTYLQVSLLDNDRAAAEAPHMQEVLGHLAVPWQEREKIWLDVFHALRASSALTVSTIILISGLGMFNTLGVIVLEKAKEIAILRSMGYQRGDITRIFLLLGGLVLVAGCVLGCALGAFGTWLVANIPLRIRGIFSTDYFVVAWSPWHYVWAIAAAAVVVLLASWIPARRAAQLEPGDIIRGLNL